MPDKYNPTEDEMKAAEAMLTDEQRAMSEERENDIEKFKPVPIVKVSELIKGINTENLPDDLEGQAKINMTKIRELGLNEGGDSTSPFTDSLTASFSADLESIYKGERKMKELFSDWKDQIVVDLGAGSYPSAYHIAGIYKAKGFVAVEAFHPHNLASYFSRAQNPYDRSDKSGINKHSYWYRFPERIPVAIVPEDMLSFLKRLPDNSVSVYAGNIDLDLIPRKYHNQVAAEIARVLDPNGSFVSAGSDFHLDKDNDFSVDHFSQGSGGYDIDIFKKK